MATAQTNWIFLIWYSSLLGVFVNNLDLGRQYAKHERLLYLIHTYDVTSFLPIVESRKSSAYLTKALLEAPKCMLLRVKGMLVSRQNDDIYRLKPAIFVEIIEITHQITVCLRYVCLLIFSILKVLKCRFWGYFLIKYSTNWHAVDWSITLCSMGVKVQKPIA